MAYKILIVEDDENISRLERDYLEANDFEVDCAYDGVEGLRMARNNEYALLILDIMLPGIDGLEICKAIRETINTPIILVSAKRDDFDKVQGFGFGADDYIVKPFSPSELVARVKAHISRYERLTTPPENDVIIINDLRIEKDSRRVFYHEQEITFTNKEFDLLATLAQNPNTVYTKEDLISMIWNYEAVGDTSTVTVHINRIREKLFAINPNNEIINTVWGKGYRFYK